MELVNPETNAVCMQAILEFDPKCLDMPDAAGDTAMHVRVPLTELNQPLIVQVNGKRHQRSLRLSCCMRPNAEGMRNRA
eukprot:1154299-Pelagomonas_calceolata.AAC.3